MASRSKSETSGSPLTVWVRVSQRSGCPDQTPRGGGNLCNDSTGHGPAPPPQRGDRAADTRGRDAGYRPHRQRAGGPGLELAKAGPDPEVVLERATGGCARRRHVTEWGAGPQHRPVAAGR
jgi:hypothetical protein